MNIRKKIAILFIVCFSIFSLTGCLERVEINKLGLVTGIGIDKNEDTYVLTVQILNPAAISGQNQNSLPVYNLKAEGQSIHEAFSKVGQITSSALFLSHLNAIVINEEFAESGFAPLLNFSLRHAEIRPDISIVVAKGNSAHDVLSVVTALDNIPAAQLNAGAMVSSHAARLINYNFYEVVDMVNNNTMNLVLNAVSIHRETDHLDEKVTHKDGTDEITQGNGSTIDNILDVSNPVQLRIEHLAVFQSDKIVGFLNTDEAQLYNMVIGQPKRYVLVTRLEDEYYTSVRIPNVETKITTDLANNEATIKMNLSAVILENTYPIDLTNTDNLTIMSDHIKNEFEKQMQDFVDKVQSELKSDIFGIGGQAYYHENKVWKELQGYWEDLFPDVNINLEIEVKIDSVGEIGNVTL